MSIEGIEDIFSEDEQNLHRTWTKCIGFAKIARETANMPGLIAYDPQMCGEEGPVIEFEPDRSALLEQAFIIEDAVDKGEDFDGRISEAISNISALLRNEDINKEDKED